MKANQEATIEASAREMVLRDMHDKLKKATLMADDMMEMATNSPFFSAEDSLKWADDVWAHCDNQINGGYYTPHTEEHQERLIARWRSGQEQADRFRERVVEELRKVVTT
jgi:hypothetical protein